MPDYKEELRIAKAIISAYKSAKQAEEAIKRARGPVPDDLREAFLMQAERLIAETKKLIEEAAKPAKK